MFYGRLHLREMSGRKRVVLKALEDERRAGDGWVALIT